MISFAFCCVIVNLTYLLFSHLLVERSIYNCYLKAIENAEYFIYIENQFFISSCSGAQNKVVEALVKRICRAIDEKKPFRVVVILPLHPEGSFDATSTRILFKVSFVCSL